MIQTPWLFPHFVMLQHYSKMYQIVFYLNNQHKIPHYDKAGPGPSLDTSISICTFIFCTYTIPVFNWYIVITSPPWAIYCLTSLILLHLHTLYTLYTPFLLLLTVCLFIPCVTLLLLSVSNCFALSWPGRSCKWELDLNWPTWLNKGEIKI